MTVPLHSAEHFYVVTDAVDGTHPDLPVMRDPDGWTYFKEEVGGLVVGGFEPEAKPWVAPDQIPYPFEFALLEEDWEHFSVLMDEAVRRVPALEHTGIRKFYNGPESFTPDNQFLMGEAPGLRGFFVGAGFNSVGIASAGGAGRALAEWVVAGEPTSDLVAVDLRRFAPYAGDHAWLRERVVETLGIHYAVPWPNREPETGRDVRLSPLHDAPGGEGCALRDEDGLGAGQRRSGAGRCRSDLGPAVVAAPPRPPSRCACRTAVAVFDQTSFSKYAVSGPDALAGAAVGLRRRRRRAGRTLRLHAAAQRPRDATRPTSPSPAPARPRSSWSAARRPRCATSTGSADILPIARSASTTSPTAYAVLGVMGPRSRELMARRGPGVRLVGGELPVRHQP